MAQLTTLNVLKLPLGNKWLVFGEVSENVATSGQDYIAAADIGLVDVDAAFIGVSGAGPLGHVHVKNSQDTANAEGSSPGDIAIDSLTGGFPVRFWAVGRGPGSAANKR